MSGSEHEPIKVVSFDYDDCLREAFGGGEHESEAKIFFRNALQGAKSLYIGTARQSRRHEYAQAAFAGKPSFANYESFARDNRVSLVPLLLEDVWQGKPEGTYFEEAKNAVKETTDIYALHKGTEGIKEPLVFPHKIGLVYLQMQHAAQRAKGTPVAFHFYDDAGPNLKDMLAFFKRHPKLMPRNLSLLCHHVDLKGLNNSGFIKNQELAFGGVAYYISDPLQGQGVVLSQETLAIVFKATLEALVASEAESRLQLKFGDGIDDDTDAPRETLFAETLLKHYPKNSTEAVASSETSSLANKPSLPSKGDSHKEWLSSPKTRRGLVAGTVVGGGVFGVASAMTSMVLANAFASAGAAASLANVLAANPIAIGLAAFALVGAVLASVMGGFLGQSCRLSGHSMIRQDSSADLSNHADTNHEI